MLRLLSQGLLGLALLLCALAVDAHVVYGTKTLQGLVAEADLVLRARIVASGERVGLSSEDGGESRPSVEAFVLEVLKGDLDAKHVRFAQHGHGVARFEPGSETLLFLLDIERSRELAALARSGVLSWVSLQEHDDAYPVEAGTGDVLLAAVRGYARAGEATPAAQRQAALRQATVAMLTSGDAKLAASALRDLVAAPTAPLVGDEDVPVLAPLLDDPDTSMGVRAALLAELDRRGLVDGSALWPRLLSAEAPTRDRVTAVRAAGASGGPAAKPRLVSLLADADAEVAAAAADALGSPGDVQAVAPLARALSHDSSRVRMAAIRGLGRIATPAADRALRSAVETHPDPATRRRANAEIRKRGAGRAAQQ